MKAFSKIEKILIYSVLGFAMLLLIGFFLYFYIFSNAMSP